MSKTKPGPNFDPRRPRATWQQHRFIAACKAKGIHSHKDLRDAMSVYRGRRGESPPLLGTAQKWWSGEQRPTMGAVGKEPSLFELADMLEVSLDYLCYPNGAEQ